MIGELLEAFRELGSADFGDRAVAVAMLTAALTYPTAIVLDLVWGALDFLFGWS